MKAEVNTVGNYFYTYKDKCVQSNSDWTEVSQILTPAT